MKVEKGVRGGGDNLDSVCDVLSHEFRVESLRSLEDLGFMG